MFPRYPSSSYIFNSRMIKRIMQAKLSRTVYEEGRKYVPFSVRKCSQNCLKCSRSAVGLHKHCNLVDSSLKFLKACCSHGCFSHLTWDEVLFIVRNANKHCNRLSNLIGFSLCSRSHIVNMDVSVTLLQMTPFSRILLPFPHIPPPPFCGREELTGSTLHKQKQCNLFL
jgi:hypothetical protein